MSENTVFVNIPLTVRETEDQIIVTNLLTNKSILYDRNANKEKIEFLLELFRATAE